MDWFKEYVSEAIWGWFEDLTTDLLNSAFKLVVDNILAASDLYKYFEDLDKYLIYAQTLAGSLLVVTVVWQGFKQLSGRAFNEEEKSIETLAIQTIFSGFFIYFLPKSVSYLFLPANNAVAGLISSIGTEIVISEFQKKLGLLDSLANVGGAVIMMMLILGIAFLILGIVSGIRYVELIIAVLAAPFSSISIVKNGEGVSVWARETTAIVFSQCIHILLLKIMMGIMGKVDGIMMIVLCLGVLSSMIKGPQILRTYLYSTGVSSASVGAIGQGTRMAALKFVMQSAVPSK